MTGTALARQNGAIVPNLTAQQQTLIRRTVAPDLTPQEFDLFIEQCRMYGLSPITKQIYAVVYNAKNEAKRNVTLIVGINGLRSIAERTGRYRPDDRPPRYEIDPAFRDEQTNPHGLIRAEVTIYKADARGEWFPVTDEAYWDEYAPVEEEWKWGEKKGERIKTGEKTLGGMWGKMPRAMLAKVAEARALRRAFPEMSGLYSDDEMARADAEERDRTASEIVAEQEREQRRARLGDEKAILLLFEATGNQEAVPVPRVTGRLIDYYRRAESTGQLDWFVSANKEALKQFWAEDGESANEAKAVREERFAILQQREREEAEEQAGRSEVHEVDAEIVEENGTLFVQDGGRA